VNLLDKSINFVSKRQPFKKYLLVAIIVFFLYLSLNFLFQAIPFQSIDFGNNVTFNKTAELEKMALDYSQNKLPDLANSFWKIFFNNILASLYILVLPIVILLILNIIEKSFSIFNGSLLKLNSALCKIFLLSYSMFNYVAITFSQLYFVFILPLPVFLITYTHGIFEIPAMILSFTFGLLLIDDFFEIFDKNQKNEIKTLVLIFLKNFLIYVTILTCILLIAAFIETQITPQLIQQSFENYFLSL
jgi:uncharacterized membrane protein SpoIIM required for sporulation